MKYIPLTQGKFAIVDEEKYDELIQYKWWYCPNRGNSGYARRHLSEGKNITMHRQILGLKAADGKVTDHRNHNCLDNRLANLRICTNSQNLQNSLPRKNVLSKYKGVSLTQNNKTNKWHTLININGKDVNLGYFNDEIEAAKVYDAAAAKHFGEFAYLNFPI